MKNMKHLKQFITFTGNFAKLSTPLVKVINFNQFITFTGKFANLSKRLGKSEKYETSQTIYHIYW